MPISIFDHDRPPLSMLTSIQIMDLAREFRDLALKAATPHVGLSLSILALRYAHLAAKRELEERDGVQH